MAKDLKHTVGAKKGKQQAPRTYKAGEARLCSPLGPVGDEAEHTAGLALWNLLPNPCHSGCHTGSLGSQQPEAT